MKRLFLLLLLAILRQLSVSQAGPYLFSGTGYLSNGEIGLLLDDAEAGIVLPALLADRETGGWAVGASKRSGINDLTEVAATAHFKLPWKDQLALGVQHTGIEGFSEQRITLSYARKLFQNLNLGVQFDLNRNAAEELDDAYSTSWSVSIHAPLMKELSMSALVYNPLGTETKLDLPSLARIGVLYTPSDKVGVAIEVEKDWRHDARFKAGLNYRIHPRLAIRWGVGTNPGIVNAGISWNLIQNMALNAGWRYHSTLGSSLSAGLSSYKYK